MINWKKENYIVGQEVFVIQKTLYSKIDLHLVGTVIYVGTKKLKIIINETEYTFSDGRNIKGLNFLGCLYIYKNKEEYENFCAKTEKEAELREFITKEIKTIELEDLEKIKDLIIKNKNL